MARTLWAGLVIVSLLLAGCKTSDQSGVSSEEAAAKPTSTYALRTLADVQNKSADELYAIFKDGRGDGAIPVGNGQGFPIFLGDAADIDQVANRIWGARELKQEQGQGAVTIKTFVGPMTYVRAKVATGRLSDVRASLGDFMVDDKSSLVVNYGDAELKTVPPFNQIVDEMRLVNPETKLYLGRSYMADNFMCYFALQFTE